jgi:hypothetical protein
MEKISPTRNNVVIGFLDLQENIVVNSQTLTIDQIRRSAGALAKLASLHNVPTFISAVQQGGAFLKEVTDNLKTPKIRMRNETSAFSDLALAKELKEWGREIIILAGVAVEIVVQRTALQALSLGYTVHIAVDACGGINSRTEAAAWQRLTSAGAIFTSTTTLAAELAGDFTTELGMATLGIMYETIGR